MTGAILSSMGDYGTLSRLIADSRTVHDRLDLLTAQIGSGKIGTTYAALGGGAATSLDLTPAIGQLATWQKNIDAAATRIEVAQTALTRLQEITKEFVARTFSENGLDAATIDNVAVNAKDALSEVANLLDTQEGGLYVFAGQDTANPPIPNPNAIGGSPFFTQIQAAVQQLATLGASGTAASTLATAASNAPTTSPFSTYLSQPVAALQAPVVQVGDGQMVVIGLFASGNSTVASTGGSTTGSYARDLMRALATLGSLSSTQANDPNLAGLIDDTRQSLNGALTAMAGEAGVLGGRQAALETTKAQLAATAIALTTQVSNAEDVDVADAMAKLSVVQTQLQASYQLIARAGDLSLVKFLPSP
ncbi:MAG: hypothetical protein J0H67_22020 [Rhodospirillales bacterium]|nr:hypothetical protein [Rhodospirillales bacterium]